jgi:glycosyltransferase involved in cell wall biosynthesis
MSQTLPRLDESPDTLALVASTRESASPPLDAHVQIQPSFPEPQAPIVEVAIPVHNEEKTLEQNVRRLRTYLDESFPFVTTIRIVDNASSDGTWEVATRISATLGGVSALHLDEKGKGRAIRAAWSTSSAQIVAYMDVDLSTDLGGLLPLVAPVLSGHSDVSIGSRFAPGAHVLRGARREAVSRSYNLLLRAALGSQFSDATCGFKAARRETAQLLLPLVNDDHWFFDTEFLVSAERNGFRIHEVPVDWIDDSDSRVSIQSVARDDLRGIARLMRARAFGHERFTSSDRAKQHIDIRQRSRYAGVGILSTAFYLAVFFLLRDHLGTYEANVVALALSTIGNTIAHLRFTFGPRSGMRMRQATVAGCLAFATGVALTTLCLGLEEVLGITSASSEGLAIVIGIVAAAFVRLVLLRASAYRTHTQGNRKVAGD